MKQNQETITLPKKSFKNLLEVLAGFDLFRDEIEDYLLAKDRAFIKKMRKARQEHKRGRLVGWEALKDNV